VLEKHILPRLQEFHTRRGVRVLTGSEWAQSLREKFADKDLDDSCREALAGTLTKLERSNSIFMPVGMIAGDLKPENVHYDGGRWVILDWANTRKTALLPDIMCNLFYVATAKNKHPEASTLREFLRGQAPMHRLPGPQQDSMRVWQRWMQRWFAKDAPEDLLRLQIEGSVWDWLGTMTHPWNPVGGLWPHMSPSADFLRVCTTRDLPI
jgi:Ser/Thr protein kinase RdoA (MazF antagonist)